MAGATGGKRGAIAIVVGFLACSLACGGKAEANADAGTTHGSTMISAASFDQRCAVDTDCTIAYSGDVCASCTCPDDAIARSAQAA